MQVSWIDPDEVRDLLCQIEGPRKGSSISGWEVHTLPAAPMAERPVEPLVPSGGPAPVPRPASPPVIEVPAGPANAELWRIRERLRALRDKAQTAGIFTRPPPGAAAPNLASEAPEKLVEPVNAPAPAAVEHWIGAGRGEARAVTGLREPAFSVKEAWGPRPEKGAEAMSECAAPKQSPQASPLAPHENPFTRVEPRPAFEPLFAIPAPLLIKPQGEPEAALPAAPASEAPAKVVASPPFVVSPLGLSERLNGMAAWVCARLGTHEVLLVDDYGDVLWGAQGQTALVLSAMMAWHSAQRASAPCIDPQRIDKSLGAARALTVLPMRTRYGVVSLAVIQDKPVSDADAAAIRAALALAVEGPNDGRADEGA